MNPRITTRNQNSPQDWGSAGPGNAWHHMIPYALLRDVWNRLVDQHIATQWPEARIAIRQYLSLCDRNLPNLEELLDRMRAENTTQRRTGHNALIPLDVVDLTILQGAAVWPVWNIVGGPKERSDDPHDGNAYDRYRVGLTPFERERMGAVEILLEEFQIFANAGVAPGQNAFRRLADVLQAMRPILACDKPIPFRPSMWIKEGTQWRKRMEHEAE